MKRIIALLQIFAVFLLLRFSPALAQSEIDLGNWSTITLQKVLNRFQLYGEVQLRTLDGISTPETLVLLPALGYRISQTVEFNLGYGRYEGLPSDVLDEDRIFQHAVYRFNVSGFELDGRSRLEERFFDGVSGVELRLRKRFRLRIPLDEEKRWKLLLSEELFLNLNKQRPDRSSGVDQNRLIMGVIHRISENFGYELGMMFQTDKDNLNQNLILTVNLEY